MPGQARHDKACLYRKITSMHWQTSRHLIDLTRPRVMGIVNVTPDSFSDGGRYASTRAALAHCEQLLAQMRGWGYPVERLD